MYDIYPSGSQQNVKNISPATVLPKFGIFYDCHAKVPLAWFSTGYDKRRVLRLLRLISNSNNLYQDFDLVMKLKQH